MALRRLVEEQHVLETLTTVAKERSIARRVAGTVSPTRQGSLVGDSKLLGKGVRGGREFA